MLAILLLNSRESNPSLFAYQAVPSAGHKQADHEAARMMLINESSKNTRMIDAEQATDTQRPE
ncbi:hypothetical protein Tcan_05114 [Toxocara canis]|uniref:Uncharacterized protein n=1 Tax=Toxocara canis TaxID=6265 RepID=A0A0B2VQW7_TOXCA|nr:hypothetical protein Tcan_05114 [Toxocara canis]